jgi:hypothetical protein
VTDPGDRPDIEIGAAFSAKRLRFKSKPKTHVEFNGEPRVDSVIESERENLPEEVEPNVTYHDVHVRWGAAGRLRHPSDGDDADG